LGEAFAKAFNRQLVRRDAELDRLHDQLESLRNLITQASVEAQLTVGGSSNDPATTSHMLSAVALATEVCQRLASLFATSGLLPEVHTGLLAARVRFREVVTDEDNINSSIPTERENRSAEIEDVCSRLDNLICRVAFERWKLGIGKYAGKIRIR
jgi:hypothetical protein